MMNQKVKIAIAGLLDMFRSGEIPEKIAIVTNPKFDVPSSNWSFNNRLIQLFHGTFDFTYVKHEGQLVSELKPDSTKTFTHSDI